MEWNELNDPAQLEQVRLISAEKPVLIFKHSTRCSISKMMLDRLERNWKQDAIGNLQPFFLDLIRYRDISNAIAENFNVPHESPQVLIVKDGQSIQDFSHMEIDFDRIADAVNG